MREALALVRAGGLTATSYRLRILMSIGGLFLSAVPLYFVTGALQPTMAEPIQAESDQYFAFVLVGTIALSFVFSAVQTLPSQVSSSITTGILEALLSTRAPVSSILAGLSGFDFVWTGMRGLFLLLIGWGLGAQLAWGQILPATLIVLLLIASMLPFGILSAALMLAFRTSGPLPQAVLFVSAALGGVYYPTTVIPSWIQLISDFVPLSYALRALRRVLIRGESLMAVRGDLLILIASTAVLLLISSLVFGIAFRYSKRAGTLTQY